MTSHILDKFTTTELNLQIKFFFFFILPSFYDFFLIIDGLLCSRNSNRLGWSDSKMRRPYMAIKVSFRRQLRQWCGCNDCEDKIHAGYQGIPRKDGGGGDEFCLGWTSFLWEGNMWVGFGCKSRSFLGQSSEERDIARWCIQKCVTEEEILTFKKWTQHGYFPKEKGQRQRNILLVSFSHYGE